MEGGRNVVVMYNGHMLIKMVVCQFRVFIVLLLMDIMKLDLVSAPSFGSCCTVCEIYRTSSHNYRTYLNE
jgi:hypothetical protein